MATWRSRSINTGVDWIWIPQLVSYIHNIYYTLIVYLPPLKYSPNTLNMVQIKIAASALVAVASFAPILALPIDIETDLVASVFHILCRYAHLSDLMSFY